jgi:hypothetical protein
MPFLFVWISLMTYHPLRSSSRIIDFCNAASDFCEKFLSTPPKIVILYGNMLQELLHQPQVALLAQLVPFYERHLLLDVAHLFHLFEDVHNQCI